MVRILGKKKMGKFSVTLEVANYGDIANADAGILTHDKVRRLAIPAVVDSRATSLGLPQSAAKHLGLRPIDKVRVRYADGRKAMREVVGGVSVQLLGRQTVLSAMVEPKRRTGLIGAIVLEALDLLVDCTHQRLVPRDPRHVIYEIE
jgi:predicted aspartyl protease